MLIARTRHAERSSPRSPLLTPAIMAALAPSSPSPIQLGHSGGRGFRELPPERMRALQLAGGGLGCDAMEMARQAALRQGQGMNNPYGANNPGMMALQNPASQGLPPPGVLTPDNCHQWGLAYVPIGAAVPATLITVASSVAIQPGAPFLPYAIALSTVANAGNISISSIVYGVDNKLIGGVLSGELFIVTSQQPGYRLPGDKWVLPGQSITIGFTAVAAVAAGDLIAQCYGFRVP